MAGPSALERLLHVRRLQEEQGQADLEATVRELRRLEDIRNAAAERGRRGSCLVTASAHSGELTDRLAGLEEIRATSRHAKILSTRIEAAEMEVIRLREIFLAKRVERRQAETLIEKLYSRNAIEVGRRSQQALDDWYRSRKSKVAATEMSSENVDVDSSQEAIRKDGTTSLIENT